MSLTRPLFLTRCVTHKDKTFVEGSQGQDGGGGDQPLLTNFIPLETGIPHNKMITLHLVLDIRHPFKPNTDTGGLPRPPGLWFDNDDADPEPQP